MQAGSLRRTIKVQQQTPTADDRGGQAITWTDVVASAYAAIEPLSGSELNAAQQYDARVHVRVRLRYRAGIKAGMRVVEQTGAARTLRIHAVLDEDSRHREAWLLCEEYEAGNG